mmetsp:Transcript_7175/g.18357  ORF Transcript_7175/g.18357 Transcript_7175/m.18357 type:complete len:220 (-) Transcript_7175:779-1438(-)
MQPRGSWAPVRLAAAGWGWITGPAPGSERARGAWWEPSAPGAVCCCQRRLARDARRAACSPASASTSVQAHSCVPPPARPSRPSMSNLEITASTAAKPRPVADAPALPERSRTTESSSSEMVRVALVPSAALAGSYASSFCSSFLWIVSSREVFSPTILYLPLEMTSCSSRSLSLARCITDSSTVSAVVSRSTSTVCFWPMRWQRSCACRSACGFQSES